MSDRVIDNVACTVCACLCDDLRVTVRDEQIVRAERACSLAEPWFRAPWTSDAPAVSIRGQAAEFSDAVRTAADILREAKAPLFYGLSKSSTDGQRAAIALADRLGATIDTTASEGHAPSILAMQQCGESTCSLGEIRNRADLVIYWGADPVETHPRHMERYSMEPTGLLIPNGRSDRTLVVIDKSRTATAQQADWFLQVDEENTFEALWTLRGLLKGIEPASDLPVDDSVGDELPADIQSDGNSCPGPALADLKKLADMMKSCRCGVVFFGYGVAQQDLGHCNVEALLKLVIELNQFTRFHARRMRVIGDVSGADSVLCWQTGYPFSVNLARGYPRYSPGEYSAADVLQRRETDALVLIGTAKMSTFPPAAIDHLRTIPTIVLDRVNAPPPPNEPTVHFVTATYGIHRPGIAYRMDEVPIRLRPLLESPLPTDAEVLREIHNALLTN